jgi:NAD(P)-dependent dehydrogenase (short-subunit alcohol dehydrogenase family)
MNGINTDLAEQWPVDRTVVITGASGGLGSACVRQFAEAGAHVVIMARRAEPLEALAAALGGEIDVRVCDTADPESVAMAFEGLDVDVLVHGAGDNTPEPFLEVEPETFDRLMAVNVRSAFFTCQAAARSMRRHHHGGALVVITSQLGHVGAAGRTVYCTAKHAVEGLVKALGVELAPEGIRAVSVAPTYVETALTASLLADVEFRQSVLDRIPMGRIGVPEEVASAVFFAASPGASLITGSSLLTAGGWVAR